MLTSALPAQPLRFDTSPPPPTLEGKASLDLAAQLTEEIDRRTALLPGITDPALTAARFRIEVRRLIRDLLLRGEELGDPGAPHILLARTLWNRIDELHALADRIEHDPALALAAAAFNRAMQAPDRTIPADVARLDRHIRDLFALLAETGAAANPAHPSPIWRIEPWRVGWGAAPRPVPLPPVEPLSASVTRWSAPGDENNAHVPPLISQGTAEALRRFDEQVITPAQAWHAYRADAADTLSLLHRAARVIESPPAWLPAPLRADLARRFDEAARAFAAPSQPADRARARTDLRRLALAADLTTTLDALTGPAASVRSTREALAAAIKASNESGTHASLDPFTPIFTLLATWPIEDGSPAATPKAESRLTREVRPAYRAIEAAASRTRDTLWTIPPRLTPNRPGLAPSDPMSDPAIVSALASHRQSLADLRAVETIDRWLRDIARPTPAGPAPGAPHPPPLPSPSLTQHQARLAAAKVLRLGQALARDPDSMSAPDSRAAPLAEIRSLAADLHDLLSFPGEPELRAAAAARDPAWSRLAGGPDRLQAVVQSIDTARAAWLGGWAEARDGDAPPDAAAAVARLRLLATLVPLLHDAVSFRGLTDPAASPSTSPLQSWAGWDLSPAAMTALARQAEPPLAPAVDTALSPDFPAANRTISDAAQAFAPHRLIAELHRRAAAAQLTRAPALIEITAPPTSDAWMIHLRGNLAAICRDAEEHAHALSTGDAERQDRSLDRLNSGAEDVLRTLRYPQESHDRP